MNKKRVIFLIILLTTLVTTITVLYRTYYSYNKTTTKSNTQQNDPLGITIKSYQPINKSYVNWLEQEETSVWNELSKKINISSEYCETLRKQWYDDYKNGEDELKRKETKKQTISKITQNRIDTILHDFGLSTDIVSLISWKDNSAAAATDTSLFINERVFCKLPHEAQKFVIGHEIQHYIHKDCSTNYILNRFYKTKQKDLPKDHPINRLNRFQELRADIQSALRGPEYAKGYVMYMEILSKKRDNRGITHPKNSLRLSMGKKLISNLRIA